jgi:hypothetical protein
MTLKHTPGPWTLDEQWVYALPDSRLPSYSNHGAYIPLFNGCQATLPGDLRLISAAPDLLAALQYMTDILSSSVAPDDYEPFRACISQARAAISKATGE